MAMTSQFADMRSSSNFLNDVLFLLPSPSFISISSMVLEIWQFSFIRDWPEIRKSEIPPSEFCLTSKDWDQLGIPNFVRMFLQNVTMPGLQLLPFLSYEVLTYRRRGGWGIRVNSLIHSSHSSIWVFKKNRHSNVSLKFLCDAKLITSLFYFWYIIVPVKTTFLYLYILKLRTFEYGCLVLLHTRRWKDRGRVGRTDEQPLSDKPTLIRCEGTYSTKQS